MTKYIFICSPGHSGSTLFDLILGAHPEILSLGEISFLPKNIALNTLCSCGVPVKSCLFWRRIIHSLSDKLEHDLLKDPYFLNLGLVKSIDVIDTSRQTAMYLAHRKIVRGLIYLEQRHGFAVGRLFRQEFQNSIENNLLLYDTALMLSGSKMIVDSSKDYLKAIEAYKKSPNNVRIIILSRDGRGVLYSRLKRGVSRKEGVKNWLNYYKRGIPVIKRNVPKEHFFYIKYEDIVEQTTYSLRRVCDFIGLPYVDSMIDFSNYPHHITNGNNMRLSREIAIKLDESWKTKLTDKDSDYFMRKAGKVNQILGYGQ